MERSSDLATVVAIVDEQPKMEAFLSTVHAMKDGTVSMFAYPRFHEGAARGCQVVVRKKGHSTLLREPDSSRCDA
jgi:hypothetical protein